MSFKPHIYFRNPPEGVASFKQKSRYGGAQEDDSIYEKDYTPKRDDFIRSITLFYEGKKIRESHRNHALQVPTNVDYIKIYFHDVFDSSIFENRYRANFGLSPVFYTEFNTIGLFAIVESGRFEYFIKQLHIFIETTDHLNPKYHPDIKFIKEFTFFSSEQIIHYREYKKHIVINLIDNVELFQNYFRPIEASLLRYLKEKGANFYQDLNTNKIELLDAPEAIVKEIADNFDIIQSINAYAAGYVKPSVFNLPDKSFGFEVSNSKEDLPIIGIIDTGISEQTPLKGLIVNVDNALNLTSTPLILDEANHGTAVATLAALGAKLYPNHIGIFEADAKLLIIKTLNTNEGYIAESEVIRLIRTANEQYGVQIFTLTIGYTEHKTNNEEVSEYAFALDKLCNELNILIFIATGNNDKLTFWDGKHTKPVTYPLHFLNENSNLCSPAESMNNITVGASASNFENNEELRISPVGSVPAIYTRTSHLNWMHDSQYDKNGEINWRRANKKLFKPDVCNNGGDYDSTLNPSTTGIKVLSTETGIFFDRSVGTSFSTPLTANLAAKILKTYPKLKQNMQTVKALIINSAQDNDIGSAFAKLTDILPNAILGNGIPNDVNCLFSSENRVTIILEDAIKPDEIKSYPINIPKYLLDVNRTNALLKVKATLCFKFEPLKHHHLAYCPIHMAFGVFKNLPLNKYLMDEKGNNIKDEKNNPISIGINDNKTSNFVFDKSWSQDYYFKAKMLSNAQKIDFSISKKVLFEEKCILRIAVNAKLHKLLNDLDRSKLVNKTIKYSIVFTIEETPIKNTNTNMLYDELTAVNTLEAINILEAELEADVSR
jgi:subtilisin family serine protease